MKEELSEAFKTNEKEKKRLCNDRIMQVDGTFIPFVMPATREMGRESSNFYSSLSELIIQKREKNSALL